MLLTFDCTNNPEYELWYTVSISTSVLGKRYESKSGIIVLCTKAGAGIIHCDGIPMNEVKPKRLPSSD